MPLVRMTEAVSAADLPGAADVEVQLPAHRAQEVVANGWGVLVRSAPVDTPEARVQPPEQAIARRRSRGGGNDPAADQH